jgi:hypothetical protein
VIRDILRGRLVADRDPRGLRLRGARITGRLDLQDLTTDVHLELKDCLLEEGILARHARLAFVGLTGCQLEHPAEPPFDATGLTCSVLTLTRARVIGHTNTGAVNLYSAHVGGNLDCTGAELCNDSGPALSAERLQVGQGMFLAAVVAVSCVLAVALGAHGALAQTSKTAAPGRSCSVVQLVSVGLDLNLPVGTSVARADCDLTTDSASVTAAWLTAIGWVLQVLAWVFAALFIAGFTSAVRKT